VIRLNKYIHQTETTHSVISFSTMCHCVIMFNQSINLMSDVL
jgi:hypothetical protein